MTAFFSLPFPYPSLISWSRVTKTGDGDLEEFGLLREPRSYQIWAVEAVVFSALREGKVMYPTEDAVG